MQRLMNFHTDMRWFLLDSLYKRDYHIFFLWKQFTLQVKESIRKFRVIFIVWIITAYAESFIYQIHKSPLKEVTTILLIARINSIELKKEITSFTVQVLRYFLYCIRDFIIIFSRMIKS